MWIAPTIYAVTIQRISRIVENKRRSVRCVISISERLWFIIGIWEVESMPWNTFVRQWINRAAKPMSISVYCPTKWLTRWFVISKKVWMKKTHFSVTSTTAVPSRLNHCYYHRLGMFLSTTGTMERDRPALNSHTIWTLTYQKYIRVRGASGRYTRRNCSINICGRSIFAVVNRFTKTDLQSFILNCTE